MARISRPSPLYSVLQFIAVHSAFRGVYASLAEEIIAGPGIGESQTAAGASRREPISPNTSLLVKT